MDSFNINVLAELVKLTPSEVTALRTTRFEDILVRDYANVTAV